MQNSLQINCVSGFVKLALSRHILSREAHGRYGTYSRTAANCASKGYCANLLELKYLDFSKPWWSQRLLESATIKDKLYFATGDISVNTLYMMDVVFFNKELLTKFQLEDPYQLVKDGKWTFDKMIEMAQGLYQDLNNNSAKDKEDMFGAVTINLHFEALFDSVGLNVLVHDEEKGLVFSPDFYGEKINQYLNKLIDWKTGNDVYCNEDMVYKEIFAAERSLFCIDRAYLAAQHLVNSEIKYGVLPLPKWDEAQEKYISGMANPITLYCVSAYSVDPDRAAAVMECLAVEGYKNTTPALFEEFFKARYADEEIDAQMFDLIRETIHYQIGRIFTDQITGWMVFFNQYCVNNRNWNSTWASNKGVAEATLRRFLEALENG